MRFKFLNLNKASLLPKSTGVYAFKNGQKFLYIGKAVNIKERVKNHFRQSGFRDNFFINKAQGVGFLKTDSEIEALILEASFIKKYRPKYNIVWRDDKNYFFVGITKEDFPRVFISHQPKLEIRRQPFGESLVSLDPGKLKINYVGPFIDGKSLKQTLKVLRKVFPYRSCKILPKRPCLWYQLGRCPGPCLLKSNLGRQIPPAFSEIKKECQKSAKGLFKFLRGGREKVLKGLKKDMKKASLGQDFEKAAEIRDRIGSLERILAHVRIILEGTDFLPERPLNAWKKTEGELKKILKTKGKISRIEAYDVSNFQGKLATGSQVSFIGGVPDKNSYRRFKIKITDRPNDIAMIKEVLSRRFNHPEWLFPDLILIDGGKAQFNAAKEIISGLTSGFGPRAVALAKRKNELYVENQKKPIRLNSLPNSLRLAILQVRDEAHRFAISYHRKLRDVDLKDSS